MKLKKIDKARYQERRSRIQWAMIAGLFAMSLGFAELYRYLFAGGESSLALNAAGVATGVAIVTFVLFRLRDTPYFDEVNYVWKLKQELNRIYRKTKSLDQALEAGSRDALIIKLQIMVEKPGQMQLLPRRFIFISSMQMTCARPQPSTSSQ